MNEEYLKEKKKILERAEERAQKIIEKHKKERRLIGRRAVG